jgi:transcriptional regulator with XRE-family HTH domain
MQRELSLGEYVRRLRRDQRMMLQDAAHKSGLSVSHLSRIENDAAMPNTDSVVKIHRVLGGDLGKMLELADCLPPEILNGYIRRFAGDGSALRRTALGDAEDPLADQAFVQSMDPRLRRALAQAFELSERDIDGLIEALRGLAALSAAKREQVIEVLRMTTRGGLG